MLHPIQICRTITAGVRGRRGIPHKLAAALLALSHTPHALHADLRYTTSEPIVIADIRWPKPRLPDDYQPKTLTKKKIQALKPGDRFRECVRCPEMVVLPVMPLLRSRQRPAASNLRTQTRVAFGRFEVTFGEWAGCVAHANCRYIENLWGQSKDQHPVTNVSRIDAETYATWLTYLTGGIYRLPNDVEWDFAANVAGRRPDVSPQVRGTRLGDSAWFADNSSGHPHPVGQKPANKFGLHDMYGNVWEWISGCYEQKIEDRGPTSKSETVKECKFGVRRGGSWFSSKQFLEPQKRLRMNINGRVDDVGFRVVREFSVPIKPTSE